MNGQYKVESFDVDAIRTLGTGLQEASMAVTVGWKKGRKDLDQPEDGANTALLTVADKVVLRQTGRKGIVQLANVPEEQRETFLLCLKEQGFYSRPNWGLGIGLFVLYWLMLLLVSATHAQWLATVLMVGGVAVSILLWVLYHATLKKLNKAFFVTVMVVGGIGYLVSTLYSLLALPMVSAIMVNGLYHRVQSAGGGSVEA